MELDHPKKFVCECKRNIQKEFGKVIVSKSEFAKFLIKKVDLLNSLQIRKNTFYTIMILH
jgi:hypothetical protein